MNTVSGSSPIVRHPWIFGPIALFGLVACTTTRIAEDVQPPNVEVVDIGYGTADERSLTGSVATLRTEDLQASQPRTLADMLARIPGVRVILQGDPYPAMSVRIRGSTNSVNSGEEPLFVLDGMPMASGAGEILGLNPNVVESISVLKDAGATAIYGSRGANGVILIKTKRD